MSANGIDSFNRYCDEIEGALNICYNKKTRRKIESLAKQMIEGENINSRRIAREHLANELVGMYSHSANLQASFVDEFCKDVLGIGTSPQTYSMEFEDARDVIGELADGLGEQQSYEQFARSVCDRVQNMVRVVSNSHMTQNVVRSRGPKVRFQYIPRGPVICGYCCMVAYNGPIYTKDAKDKLHDNCSCKLVAEESARLLGIGNSETYKKGYDALYSGKSKNGKPSFKRNLAFDITTGEIVARPSKYMSARALDVKAKFPNAYKAWVDRVERGPYTIKQTANIHIPGKAFTRTSEARDRLQSTLYLSENEQYLLVQKHAGKGSPDVNRNGGWADSEVCVADSYIGEIVTSDGSLVRTKAFRIHYAGNGVHIVPRWDGAKNDG